MRKLNEVLEKMIACVPKHESLRYELESCLDSYNWSPPEVNNFWWDKVAEILNEYLDIKSPNFEWEVKLANIWLNK